MQRLIDAAKAVAKEYTAYTEAAVELDIAISDSEQQVADDAEPITLDFINQHFADMGPQYSSKQHCTLSQLVWENRFERLVLWDNPLPHIKTRGQLRRLINALKGGEA